MMLPAFTYRFYVTVSGNLIWWELYRTNNGQFELCWEFVGLRYHNWNEIKLVRR